MLLACLKARDAVGGIRARRELSVLDANVGEFDEELDTYLLEGDNVSYRATYLIDEKGTVFHESVNHMPIGRNVQEFIRLIDAYTHVQEKGEVCPATIPTSAQRRVNRWCSCLWVPRSAKVTLIRS